MSSSNNVVLKLTVRNHPGVMSQVCGLFARRCYNLEGIMVRPVIKDQARTSRIWLLVNSSNQLEQIVKQTSKLIDVHKVENVPYPESVFFNTDGYFQ